MKALLMVLFLLVFQTVRSQERLVEEFPDVFVTATEEQKSVIFIFDHPNCGWCRLFDNYHALPEVKEILDPEYLIQKIDISESETAMSLFEHYKFFGVPAWRIFSSDKELLSDGRLENGELVGYPLEPANMDFYIDAIRRTSRHIKKRQLLVLREKLVYCDEHF
jgi:hypothetical protein